RVAEGDRVVEESLPDEEREAEDAAPGVQREHRPGDRDEPYGLALPDGDGVAWLGKVRVRLPLHPLFDPVHESLSVSLPPMDEQPARAFRDVAPHQQHDHAEDDAE